MQQQCVSRLDLLHQSDLIIFQNDPGTFEFLKMRTLEHSESDSEDHERAHVNREAHQHCSIRDWAARRDAGMKDVLGLCATSDVARTFSTGSCPGPSRGGSDIDIPERARTRGRGGRARAREIEKER